MFPTSSSTDLVGRNARSATARIKGSASSQGSGACPNVSGWHKPTHKGGGSQQGTKPRCNAPHPPPHLTVPGARRPGLSGRAWWYVPPALTAWRMWTCGMTAGVGMALALSACGGGQNQAAVGAQRELPGRREHRQVPRLTEARPAHAPRDRGAQRRQQGDPQRGGDDLQRHLRLPRPQGRGLELAGVRRRHQPDLPGQPVAASLGHRPRSRARAPTAARTAARAAR